MFRISNTVVGILNILTLLLGIAALGGSAYIHIHGVNGNDCQKVLRYPLLFGGLFVFVISTLAIVGAMCRVNVALYLYLMLTFFVIVGFVLFTVFALFVTNKKVGDRVSWTGYQVTDFSRWLQHYVVNDRNWDDVKSCLVEARVCQNLRLDGARNHSDSLFFKQLSTTQFGCCMPPVQCGFTMKNATFWEEPKLVNESDCKRWKNGIEKLCYDCNSCKGGVLANIRKQWKHLTIFNVLVVILVTTTYAFACYAIRNNRYDFRYHKRRAHA
ncbi:hypothetical protein RJT34_15332 [Clitoria ternatea]|uniref:Tetraspanin-11 n=1 Tax=Clitoria ternatea TaxID=43366 RepID=A0AAN9JRP5_CLITE